MASLRVCRQGKQIGDDCQCLVLSRTDLCFGRTYLALITVCSALAGRLRRNFSLFSITRGWPGGFSVQSGTPEQSKATLTCLTDVSCTRRQAQGTFEPIHLQQMLPKTGTLLMSVKQMSIGLRGRDHSAGDTQMPYGPCSWVPAYSGSAHIKLDLLQRHLPAQCLDTWQNLRTSSAAFAKDKQ
jgi:hypothetical protein